MGWFNHHLFEKMVGMCGMLGMIAVQAVQPGWFDSSTWVEIGPTLEIVTVFIFRWFRPLNYLGVSHIFEKGFHTCWVVTLFTGFHTCWVVTFFTGFHTCWVVQDFFHQQY